MKLNFKIPKIPLRRKHLEILVAAALAIAAFITSWRWSVGVIRRADEIMVVAAARDLSAPFKLSAADVKALSIRRVDAPRTALINPADAPGRTLTRNLSQNEIITTHDITVLDITGSGYKIPFGLEGFSVNSSWFAGPPPKLKTNDRVTVIVSGAGLDNVKNTGIIERGIPVLEVVSGSDGSAGSILLGVTEEVAVQLLQSRANGLLLHVLLDGTGPAL